jgi:hypothetical protein
MNDDGAAKCTPNNGARIHDPCICGRQAPSDTCKNGRLLTARYGKASILLSTTGLLRLLLHTRVAACADIGEGCNTCKLPQEIQG